MTPNLLDRARPWPMYLLAAVAPVSMAAVSVAKALVLLAVLGTLLAGMLRSRPVPPALTQDITVKLVLVLLAALALSTTWSKVDEPEAWAGVAKYGKLLLIPCAIVLLRSKRSVATAIACCLASQAVILACSILLGLGIPLDWVQSDKAAGTAVVFSSYLDQSIMTACFAAMAWHLRHHFPGRLGPWLAMALAAAAVLNILMQLNGRSGYLAALTAVTLAAWWACPRRWRALVLLVPIALSAAALAVSPRIQERTTGALQNLAHAREHNLSDNSLGLRLHFWRGSLEAISERPGLGSGAGSWPWFYQQYNQGRDPSFDGTGGNPHQEYLLWGVQLGIVGIGLFVAFLAGLARDAARLADSCSGRALASIAAILAVVCLFNSTLYDGYIGDYFCVVIGLLLASGPRPQQGRHAIVREAVA